MPILCAPESTDAGSPHTQRGSVAAVGARSSATYGTVDGVNHGLMRIAVPVVATLSYCVSLVALLVWPPLTLVVFLVSLPFDRNHVLTSHFYRLLPAIWSLSFPFW